MNFDENENIQNNISGSESQIPGQTILDGFEENVELQSEMDSTDNCDVEDTLINSATQDNVNKSAKDRGFGAKILSAMALGLVFGLTASVGFYGARSAFPSSNNNKPIFNYVGSNITIDAADLVYAPEGEIVSTNISTVATNVMPAVVSITNMSVQEVESFFFGTQQYEYESSGSGIIVGKNDSELLLVTNNHVVEGNKTLTVTFVDGESVEAVVKGSDANIDIAVIAIKMENIAEGTLQKIKIASMGDSNKLIVGEPTIAIGNALGYGQSVTSGIVSALERSLDGFDTTLIQTDAAINPGNSGGALLNIRGEVIGINTAKLADDAVEGMGYAIPISEVQDIIEAMMSRETREKVEESKRGKLGILCTDVDETAIKYYHMPEGAYISEVTEGGAADNAGITKGSIIIRFDGVSIRSSTALVDLLAYYEAGETIKMDIAVPNSYGEYDKKTVTITLLGENANS